MSEDYKSPFFEENQDNNDLNSDTDNLDLNSFVKKEKLKEPKNILEKILFKVKKFLKKKRNKICVANHFNNRTCIYDCIFDSFSKLCDLYFCFC